MVSNSEASSITNNYELICLSWNIEGYRRNQMNLKHFCDQFNPSLVFISEPQAFQCDISLLTRPFIGAYSFLLNSEETNSPELAMESSKAHGGTMIMWKTVLDPFITPSPLNRLLFFQST